MLNSIYKEILRPPSFGYAETHYKFKLPWSPLFRKWPEIFMDCPHLCVPGVELPMYLCVKDAHLFPVCIRELRFHIKSGKQEKTVNVTLDLNVREAFCFHRIPIDFSDFMGQTSVNVRLDVERLDAGNLGQSGKKGRRKFLNANWPGLSPIPLQVHFLADALPYPPEWQAGELHCHSNYSSDPVEFGCPLSVMQAAGRALGLGYVLCTDHSYDFYYRSDEYMVETSPEEKFKGYQEEVNQLNATRSQQDPLLIAGEEVSCGNSKGENVHLLVAGHPKFFPGLGDGGRRWLKNKPDLSVNEVLESLESVPSFAAHPRAQIGSLERFIFRRGRWNESDMSGVHPNLRGLQFWNGHTGEDFRLGRAFWVSQLLKGKALLPIAANDAHGDLNRNSGVKVPLFRLYQGHNHLFGKVRTVIPAGIDPDLASIQSAFNASASLCSDGPFLQLERKGQSNLTILAQSTKDFGDFIRIVLFSGTKGAPRENVCKSWTKSLSATSASTSSSSRSVIGKEQGAQEGQALEWQTLKTLGQHFSETLEIERAILYYRAEAWTKSGSRALTSAFFVD